MTAAAGLLGYLAPTRLPDRMSQATERAPWRGLPSGREGTRGGEIVALGSAQITRADDLAVVIHGRIDNAASLAGSLGLQSPDPCAIVARLYRRDGDEFAAHLLGDFACLVLDERRDALIGTRDWIGARPLFWGRHGDVVAFGSEVKQVLALLALPMTPDESTLSAYELGLEPRVDATFASGVSAVLPNGQVVSSRAGADRAWRRPLRFAPASLSRASAVDAVRCSLETAVERRTVGATRLGAQLSGGMDSTAVVAAASQLAQEQRGPRIDAAFTIVFPDAPSTDESRFAREVAERWEVPWTTVIARPSDIFDGLEAAFTLHDGPTFPGFVVQTKLMAAAAAAGVDAVLAGHGGDIWLRQHGRELRFSVMRGDWRGAAEWARWSMRTAGRFGPARVARELTRGARDRFRGDRVEAWFETSAASFWTRFGLELCEREATHHGLRVEFPLCDVELARLLVGLPPSMRSRPDVTKLIVREAMAGLLPESVLTRADWTILDPVLAIALGNVKRISGSGAEVSRRYASTWRAQLGAPKHEPGNAV